MPKWSKREFLEQIESANYLEGIDNLAIRLAADTDGIGLKEDQTVTQALTDKFVTVIQSNSNTNLLINMEEIRMDKESFFDFTSSDQHATIYDAIISQAKAIIKITASEILQSDVPFKEFVYEMESEDLISTYEAKLTYDAALKADAAATGKQIDC